MELKEALTHLFTLLYLILLLRIALSWFPRVDWYKQPFKFINDVAEPILTPFRRIIPPIAGIDFSPIAAFFVLQIIYSLILNIL